MVAVAVNQFQVVLHGLFGPRAALAKLLGVQPGGKQGLVIGSKMPNGRGMQARLLLLQCAAVQRLVIARPVPEARS